MPEFSTYENARTTKVLNDAIAAALTGAKTPEKALADAQGDIDRILQAVPEVRLAAIVVRHAAEEPMRTVSRNAIYGSLLLLPAAVLLWTFTYQPILTTIVNSFYSTPRGRRSATFIGLDHYETMVADPVFWKAVSNNLVYAFTTIPLSMASPSRWRCSSTPGSGDRRWCGWRISRRRCCRWWRSRTSGCSSTRPITA